MHSTRGELMAVGWQQEERAPETCLKYESCKQGVFVGEQEGISSGLTSWNEGQGSVCYLPNPLFLCGTEQSRAGTNPLAPYHHGRTVWLLRP